MGRIMKLFFKSINLNYVIVAILIITMVTIIGFSELGIHWKPSFLCPSSSSREVMVSMIFVLPLKSHSGISKMWPGIVSVQIKEPFMIILSLSLPLALTEAAFPDVQPSQTVL